MHLVEERTGIEIPSGVTPETIMASLEIGHGYRWIILTRHPLLIAHGAPTMGNMPELLLTGEKSMVVAGGDSAYIDRIRRVLDMLQRQSHTIKLPKEGL